MRASLADAPLWVHVATGAFFLFSLWFLFTPNESRRANAILCALALTAMAIVFDWIAFGPGERSFAGAVLSGHAGSWTWPEDLGGRIVFGLAALMLDGFAGYAWISIVSAREA